MKTLPEQIEIIKQNISSMENAFTERSGKDMGKIVDPTAIHEIECLKATKVFLEEKTTQAA